MTAVFLDTSALFAAARRGEHRHAQVRDLYRELVLGSRSLVTTEFVIAELHALTLSRVGPGPALAAVRALAESSRIETAAAGLSGIVSAVDLLSRRPEGRYSLADAVAFVMMRERGIETAFTLDSGFAAEGFAVLPG